MCHDAVFEKGKRSDALGSVDDLVREEEVAGPDGLLQAADGGEGEDAADAELAESGDVGAGRDFMGAVLVVEAVAREEGDVEG